MNEPKFLPGDKVTTVDKKTHIITAVLRGAYVANGVKGTAYQLDNEAPTYDESDLAAVHLLNEKRE